MSDLQIEWVEPPTRGRYEPILREFESKPGQWGKVIETDDPKEAQRTATALRNAAKRRGGDWKVMQRTEEGVSGVWIRYEAPKRAPRKSRS